MPATYEFWLTDDGGKRITLLEGYSFFTYARSLLGLSTIQIGLPYRPYAQRVFPVFEPDRRVEVWRSADTGIPMRREGTYLLRKPNIYTRESDGVDIIDFYGRNAIDLLRRRTILQAAGTSYTYKEGYIDDLMKAIVREQMLYGSAVDVDGVVDNTRAYPNGEFTVEADLSLGPLYTIACAERNVLDVLKELKDASFQLAQEDTANLKIFFDVVQTEAGFEFRTMADLYGLDRTTGTVFSVANQNLEAPYYAKSHLEEVNVVIVKGFGRGDSRAWDIVIDDVRVKASRWNRCEAFQDGSQEPDQDNLANIGYPVLWDGEPKEQISAVFLNTPGGPDSPRSLYGVDWDLGDRLPVEYAGRHFDVEVSIVYVSMDETGKETVSGRNEVENAE